MMANTPQTKVYATIVEEDEPVDVVVMATPLASERRATSGFNIRSPTNVNQNSFSINCGRGICCPYIP